MKLNKSILLGAAALLMTATSCNDWLDVNDSPNSPTDAAAPYSKRLAHIEFYTNHAYGIATQPIGYMCGHITQNSRTNNQGKNAQWEVTTWSNGKASSWRSTTCYQWWYVGAACNIQPMIDDAMENQAWHYVGAGHLLLAYGTALMNDLHGELPAYDALGSNVTPEYNTGKEMFRYIMEQLDEAIKYLEMEQPAGTESLAANDFWGRGDINKWRKFAYLLKARQLNKLSKKAQGKFDLATENFVYDPDAILACLDKAQQSNADNMQYNYSDDAGVTLDNLGWGENVLYGPLYSCIGMNSNIYFTQMMVDNLTNFAGCGVEDPRADRILPWARSFKSGTPVENEVKWSADGKWRRTKGLDMHTLIRTFNSPYSTSWDATNSRFYCANASNEGDTIYVQQRSGGKGYYGGKDLLVYLNNNTTSSPGDLSAQSGTFFTRSASPNYLGAYHEACFIRAEVEMKKGNTAAALDAYKKGVKASLEVMNEQLKQWNSQYTDLSRCPSFVPMTQAEIDNYVAAISTNVTLGKIMTQKHIALGFNVEIWNDMRRYDFSSEVFLNWQRPAEYNVNPQSQMIIPDGECPRRWIVSSHEYNYNSTNLAAIGKKLGYPDYEGGWWNKPDVASYHVWWDTPWAGDTK